LIVYWLMFIFPALFLLVPIKADRNLQNFLFFFVGVALVFLIGLRHEVGGDWLRYMYSAYGITKGDDFDFYGFYSGDIGYRFIHWVSVNYFNGIYTTNFISAIVFVTGLLRFCKAMPIPWLALLTSIPFIVIVVSMGYTRQSVALGALMHGLVVIINGGKETRFYLYTVIGSLFHFTVLIVLPFFFIFNLKSLKRISVFFATVLLAIISATVFEQTMHMVYQYITMKVHHSDGGVIRVLVSFITAIIFFIYREKFKSAFNDERLWFSFSVVVVLLFIFSFFYSTVADRVAIYFMPLQLVVFSRVPMLISSDYYRTVFILGVVFLNFIMLFGWLNFGNHSSQWLPYQNILLN